MHFIFTREFWTFVNSFAAWFSALGTIAAVITALYLARRGDRIDLRVSAGVRVVVRAGGGPYPKYLRVEVINLGRRVATVTSVYWTSGLFRKKYAVWIVPQNALSHQIPVTVADGETAAWMMPLAEIQTVFADDIADLAGPAKWIKARRLRVGIGTSTGARFERRFEKGLREEFLKIANASQ